MLPTIPRESQGGKRCDNNTYRLPVFAATKVRCWKRGDRLVPRLDARRSIKSAVAIMTDRQSVNEASTITEYVNWHALIVFLTKLTFISALLTYISNIHISEIAKTLQIYANPITHKPWTPWHQPLRRTSNAPSASVHWAQH